MRSDTVDVLTDAAERLTVERRRLEDEIASFDAFEDAVHQLEPAPGNDGRLAVHSGGAATTPSGGFEAVRAAYERTVMGVPHYAEDYGDTYAESLREEFGSTVGAAILEGSSFNALHKSVLLSAVAEVRAGRESMLSVVEEELTAVERATEAVREVEADLGEVAASEFDSVSFGTLESTRDRLLELEERCETGLDRRQRTIARLRRRPLDPVEASDYREFFYAGLDVEYPVLSAYAIVLIKVGRRQRDVEREMAYADD